MNFFEIMRHNETKVSICSGFNLIALSETHQEISDSESEDNDHFKISCALLFTSLGKFEQNVDIL